MSVASVDCDIVRSDTTVASDRLIVSGGFCGSGDGDLDEVNEGDEIHSTGVGRLGDLEGDGAKIDRLRIESAGIERARV
jgi:hypothetical protein